MEIAMKVQENSKFEKLEYEITWNALGDPYPPIAIKLMEKIVPLITRKPRRAVEECLNAIKLYPEIPIFYNNLCCAYQHLGDYENSKKIVRELYQRVPDYLFAKCGYADLRMQEGHAEEVLQIFDGCYCLKALYPKRDVFHVTEIKIFDVTMINYFCHMGRVDRARVYLQELELVAPDEDITDELRMKFLIAAFKNPLQRGRSKYRAMTRRPIKASKKSISPHQ